MRESIGATWIFIIVITFVTVFSGYLAFSVNYSKAFKVKDGIITRLEKYNGPTKYALDDITNYLKDVGYTSEGNCKTALKNRDENDKREFIGVRIGEKVDVTDKNNDKETYNYCIVRMNNKDQEGQVLNGYYQVIVFYNLPLPIVDKYFNFTTTGETASLFYPDECETFEERSCDK